MSDGDPIANRPSRSAAENDREKWLASIDPGIRRYVDVLDAHGVETFESCQGGEGHCFLEPTVRFHGQHSAGFHAFAVAQTHAFPVSALRRYWSIEDGEPTGPKWEMTFRTPPNDRRKT